MLDLPVVGSYHTELAAYAALRSGDVQLEAIAGLALGAFYGDCDVVLSPSPATDERLAELGIRPTRSPAGSAASTSPASIRDCAAAGCSPARSTCCTAAA